MSGSWSEGRGKGKGKRRGGGRGNGREGGKRRRRGQGGIVFLCHVLILYASCYVLPWLPLVPSSLLEKQ